MKYLFIATNNQGKLAEYQTLLKNFFDKILSPKDFDFKTEPKENGQNFFDNAFVKASFYIDKVDMPVLADDGGIEIDFLNGEPGAKSRRWPGYEVNDEELINYTLTKLKNVPFEKRTCKLRVVICFLDKDKNIKIFSEASIQGHIALNASPLKTPGYPFRCLFIVDKFNKLYQDLNKNEHLKCNHRHQAVNNLILKLKDLNYFA